MGADYVKTDQPSRNRDLNGSVLVPFYLSIHPSIMQFIFHLGSCSVCLKAGLFIKLYQEGRKFGLRIYSHVCSCETGFYVAYVIQAGGSN